MGSSWREETWRVGAGSLGATLCTRVLTSPGELYVTNAPAFPNGHLLFLIPADVPNENTPWFWYGTTLPGPFPYGFITAPDVPV